MKTQENLLAAFAGESQANRRYLAFAKVAEKEGKVGLAKLFRVAAEGETIHALRHLQNSGQVKSSQENLRAAITGETHEFTTMYPEFIAEAESENQAVAKLGFQNAMAVEREHEAMFEVALQGNGEIAEQDYYICEICGHPHIGEAPEKCPVCGAPQEKFFLFQ